MIEPLPPMPMPTVEGLLARDHLRRSPGTLAASILLVQHGINPDEIPADRPDAFTEAGYLLCIGVDRIRGRIVTGRHPWPPGLTVQQITAAFDEETIP